MQGHVAWAWGCACSEGVGRQRGLLKVSLVGRAPLLKSEVPEFICHSCFRSGLHNERALGDLSFPWI